MTDDPFADPAVPTKPQPNPYDPEPDVVPSDRFERVAQEGLRMLHRFDTFDSLCIPTQSELVQVRREKLAALLRREFGP